MKQEQPRPTPVPTATIERFAGAKEKCAAMTAKQRALAQQMREYLGNWAIDFERLQDCLTSLNDEGLSLLGPEHYEFYFLNFLSVFRSKSTLGTIKQLAIACAKLRILSMWENTNYLVRLIRDPRMEQSLVLTGWDVAQLRSLLALGRGLVVCTAHIGAFRYIAIDLVRMGFKVCMAVDTNTAEQVNKMIEFSKTAERNVALPRVCDVEQNRMGTLSLVRALANNEVVLVFVDGNLGIDGLFGGKSRCSTSFLGWPVSVKSGAAQLACATNSPIVNILSIREAQDRGRVVYQFPIGTGALASQEQQEAFGHDCTQSFYRAFETLIWQFPEQWESARFLHRWRVGVQNETSRGQYRAEDEERTIASLLEERAHFRIDNQRVVALSNRKGTNLLNVESLRAYQIEPDLQEMVEVLSSELGLSGAWLDAQAWESAKRQKVVKVLAKLHYLGSVAL